MNNEQTHFFTGSDGDSRAGERAVEDRFVGAMVLSAIGDALGWPTEFAKPDTPQAAYALKRVNGFSSWKKRVGGRWWGYVDEIEPGAYSDDTQLALAVARCIPADGDFDPTQFAYAELPLWLHYERGGGRSIKAAAHNLILARPDWVHNYYKGQDVEYRSAGANGAAMRNLPIALVHCANERLLIRDSFYNAITTHGHPRAIIGAIVFGLAVRHVLLSSNGNAENTLVEYLRDSLVFVGRSLAHDPVFELWMKDWESPKAVAAGSLRASLTATRDEFDRALGSIGEFLVRPPEEYYARVGALSPATKGSGVSSVAAALFLFAVHKGHPEEALRRAVRILGSDTDTIAVFLGALLGAKYGHGSISRPLAESVQDHSYLVKVAKRLHSITGGKGPNAAAVTKGVDKRQALIRILAWEIGLHEMFWDALDEGSVVVHPTLGRGRITAKKVQPIAREGYVAKLIRIAFDCGQTCMFHSRVQNNLRVSESLACEVERSLAPERQ